MLHPDFSDLLSAFVRCEVEFLLVGAHALSVHGVVRTTEDLDVWVRRTPGNADRAVEALQAFGAPSEAFTRDDLLTADQVLQFGVSPVRIDVLTDVSGVSFDEAWPQRLEVDLDGLVLPVISREHLIANKRATGRPQDLLDVEALEGDEA